MSPSRADGVTRPVDFAVVHAAQLVRVGEGRNGPRAGKEQGQLDVIVDGALVASGGAILAVGKTSDVLAQHDLGQAVVIDATGKVVMPGLVDAHTHPLFSGLRYDEYARRLSGLEMSQARDQGGGIGWTVGQTRNASTAELTDTLAQYFTAMLRSGTTTAEAKSGYGLTPEEELRHLEIIDNVSKMTPLNVVPSFLGAHIVPPEHATAESYTEEIVKVMLPQVHEQGIAKFCDTSCGAGFSPDMAARILQEAYALGLRGRVHADGDAFVEGWPTAVANQAASADHLTAVPPEVIRKIGATDTVAVLIPAAELYYFWDRAPAREFISAGVPVAIATDFCSSIHVPSLYSLLSFAAPWFRITPEEVINATTVNAAFSLGVLDRAGTLDPGKQADLVIVDTSDYRLMIYDYSAPVTTVVAGGNVVYQSAGG